MFTFIHSMFIWCPTSRTCYAEFLLMFINGTCLWTDMPCLQSLSLWTLESEQKYTRTNEVCPLLNIQSWGVFKHTSIQTLFSPKLFICGRFTHIYSEIGPHPNIQSWQGQCSHVHENEAKFHTQKINTLEIVKQPCMASKSPVGQ